jgi:hypothetical protein
VLSWFKPADCEACKAKDERIAGLLSQIEKLMDVQFVLARLEELAKLEQRKDSELTAIEHLRLKFRAEEKAKRERPPSWMAGREEARLPPL